MSISEWFEWVLPTGFLFIDNYVEIKRLYTQGYISFASISQKKNDNLIDLNLLCIDKNDPHPNQHKLSRNFNEGETYRLTLKIDGDYMDVFLDNEKLVTLIGVDDYFAIAVRDIFRDEKIDMSRITWPRRADGSMDYSPPAGIDLSRTYDYFIFDNETTDNISNETADNIDSYECAMAQEYEEKSSLPLLLLLAIIGGAVVAVGVGVAVLRKRK